MGDMVHYAEKLNVFKSSEGSYLYDHQGVEYLDLQMWYSAVNFGYKNKRLNAALKQQIDALPQCACQYLHEELSFAAVTAAYLFVWFIWS